MMIRRAGKAYIEDHTLKEKIEWIATVGFYMSATSIHLADVRGVRVVLQR